jgi:hypothetical protein
MVRQLMAAGLAGAAALAVVAVGNVQAQPVGHKAECFYPNDWNGWKATPDSRAVYLRVGVNRIYRLEMANACDELQEPGARLITKVHGSDMFCDALDFDLSVSEPNGIPTPCIVSKMTQLTPAEAATLPRSLRP